MSADRASVNEYRQSANSVAGELSQALRHGANDDVIAEYRRRLGCERAEKALARALASAPPLSASQVAYLRSVLNQYGGDAE